MPAFEHAVGLGYRYVETDVQATTDGVCVLLHDPPPDTVRGLAGSIGRMRWSEVAAARSGGERIPRAEELFAAWPTLRVNLDIKTDAAVQPLRQLLERRGLIDRVCVGSFSDRRVRQMRAELGSRLATSMGPMEVARLRAAASRLLPRAAVRRQAVAVQIPERHRGLRVLDRAFVGLAHDLGLQVHAWTVDHADDMQRLLDLGVDGLMTDAPSLLRNVLEERGVWVGG